MNLPADITAINQFLGKHNLSGYEAVEVLMDTPKDVKLRLDYGDDEIVTITIRRRNGYNGNYRITGIS